MTADRMRSAGTSEGTRAFRGGQYATLLCLFSLAFASCAAPARTDESATGVRAGIDVLLEDGAGILAGLRVGLITNHTGITRTGRSTIDALAEQPGFRLVALFGPEHGLRGRVEGGSDVASGRDTVTGLPFRSLYGETRKPTPDMLADIDALVYDIQDVGTRYYTYEWTMALALQAAAENGKKFVVLDRPDPIGGALVQGNVLDTAFASFVGLYPVPMRYGLTVGELARLLNAEYGLGADLVVVPVRGWRRDLPFDSTGLPWHAPSPNMPSVESATHYPGTCLFEGTDLSVGRGTPDAFSQIGAPWLDADAIVERLNARALPGVRFEAVRFSPVEPGDGKFGGEEVAGIRFRIADFATYDPTVAAVAALLEIRALQPDSLTFRESHFDRLAGTDGLRRAVLDGASLDDITAEWQPARDAFLAIRERYLLYR
jgi:uncharacterized protein YbbC (DUF1343 family)